MGRRRVLLFLKSLDAYSFHQSNGVSRSTNPKVSRYLDDRRRVHKDAIEFCKSILQRKSIDWDATFRSNLLRPIQNVDLVVAVGGDGTLLQASHLLNDSIPLLGVNSDPTQPQEVQEYGDEFDATRSTGYLSAATVKNFEQILSNILEGQTAPSELSRMSIRVNSVPLSTYALNDILIADPCPASVSRFSFRIRKDGQSSSPLVNCRSSGLRVSTATGSSAAMLSAGGFPMPILSKDLQYMVREPISREATHLSLMHGTIKPEQSMDIDWYTKDGLIFIDGSHPVHPVQHGDTIQVSSHAPVLKIFLPNHLLPMLVLKMGSEFLRVQRILHQIRETEDETKTIAEVSRIKAILDDKGGFKSEVGAVRDFLLKLKQMAVSMKVLEATMIGKSVSSLQSHASKDIRQTARMLIRAWRLTVDDWIVVDDNFQEEGGESNKNPPIEKHQGRPPLVPRKFNIVSENPKKRSTPSASLATKSIVLEKKSVEEKLEATKRKMQEAYKEAHNAKRLRRTQVIEVRDVLRLGLATKQQHSNRLCNRRIRPCVGLVR
ncbi:hypothetical protein L1987_02263 [Smallanthus sonchifolius]|uniref:Uncharacterized protein n=2 Tax=Smallanthus sonchifolius TaxID=185202 RepID=A0ACB9K778_9ASTR|nr:hypothetical protein L1987_02263 [Smallanthus sonchifolius]